MREQFTRVLEAIEAKFGDAAEHLADAREDLLAFAAFPARNLASGVSKIHTSA